jgi:diacylglycerol kinase family enzyme
VKPPGVLVNVHAGRIRRDPDLVGRLGRLLPAEHLELTRAPHQVVPALTRLRDADVDTVAVVGGDGTVTTTLTALVRVWPDEPRPPLLLLPGGTINTIPHSLGVRGAPDRVLGRVLESQVPFNPRSRSVLRIYAAGGTAHCGMIFGTGIVARWLEGYNAALHKGPMGAATEVARAVGSIAFGGPLGQKLLAPFEAHVEIDGDAVLQNRYTGMAAGTVRHIGLGFQPFLSIPPEGRVGGFHWLTTDRRGFGLALELPAARLGLETPLSGLGHASARTVRIGLEEPQPYTVDGDLFGPAKEIHVATGPTIRFLAPAPSLGS